MKASVEIILRAYNIEQGYINIPAKKMYNFPDKKTDVELHIGNSIYKVNFYVRESHHGFSRLTQFFKEHRELEKGDKVIITPSPSAPEKYRLEILRK
jgi:hypothetical protein